MLGGTLGLIAASLIGALVGGLIGRSIPFDRLSKAVSMLCIAVGLYMFWQWRRGEHEEESDLPEGGRVRGVAGIAASTGVLVLLAEVGDKTQLAVVGLAATNSTVAVFIGADRHPPFWRA